MPDQRFDTFAGDRSEPQDRGFRSRAVDDGRLDPDPARPAVEHDVHVVAEVGAHVAGGRRAHPPEPVGRRRRHSPTELPQQRERDRLVGHPQADGVEPAGHRVGHVRGPGQYQGERTRPAGGGEGRRDRGDLGGPTWPSCSDPPEVHDHRVVGRATLDREQPVDEHRRGGVGTQSVDGLGRERDESTGPEQVGGVRDGGVGGRLDHGHQ